MQSAMADGELAAEGKGSPILNGNYHVTSHPRTCGYHSSSDVTSGSSTNVAKPRPANEAAETDEAQWHLPAEPLPAALRRTAGGATLPLSVTPARHCEARSATLLIPPAEGHRVLSHPPVFRPLPHHLPPKANCESSPRSTRCPAADQLATLHWPERR